MRTYLLIFKELFIYVGLLNYKGKSILTINVDKLYCENKINRYTTKNKKNLKMSRNNIL